MIYQARIAFQTLENVKERTERSTEILFRSDSGELLLRAVFRWWRDRNRNLPEYFHRLCGVKIYEITPHEIEEDGTLRPEYGLPRVEWKYDWPGTPQP